jgi:hypothetical protein
VPAQFALKIPEVFNTHHVGDTALISKPVFLIGARRSGTTLFRLMLDHHPNIAWHHHGFEYAVERISDDGKMPTLESYSDWLSTHPLFLKANLTIVPDFSYPEVIDNFLVQIMKRENKEFIGATVHHNFDKILYIWPDAHFIHIVREPRGVACSNLGLSWAGNGWAAVQSWLDAEILWKQVRKRLSADQYLEITYENLVCHTQQTLMQVCAFIGVSYHDNMMNYTAKGESLPDQQILDKWRNQLSDRDVQLIEARVGEHLVNRGYQLSGLPRISLNQWDIKRLHWQNRWFCAHHRIKRYGLPLFIADFLSRRLSMNRWQRRVKTQINEIN